MAGILSPFDVAWFLFALEVSPEECDKSLRLLEDGVVISVVDEKEDCRYELKRVGKLQFRVVELTYE